MGCLGLSSDFTPWLSMQLYEYLSFFVNCSMRILNCDFSIVLCVLPISWDDWQADSDLQPNSPGCHYQGAYWDHFWSRCSVRCLAYFSSFSPCATATPYICPLVNHFWYPFMFLSLHLFTKCWLTHIFPQLTFHNTHAFTIFRNWSMTEVTSYSSCRT